MKLYQLKSGTEWVTQNAVTDSVADTIRTMMDTRGRKHLTHYRLLDPEKVAPKKVAARAVKKAAESTGKPEGKPRTPRAKKAAVVPAESVGESAE